MGLFREGLKIVGKGALYFGFGLFVLATFPVTIPLLFNWRRKRAYQIKKMQEDHSSIPEARDHKDGEAQSGAVNTGYVYSDTHSGTQYSTYTDPNPKVLGLRTRATTSPTRANPSPPAVFCQARTPVYDCRRLVLHGQEPNEENAFC